MHEVDRLMLTMWSTRLEQAIQRAEEGFRDRGIRTNSRAADEKGKPIDFYEELVPFHDLLRDMKKVTEPQES